MLLVCLLLQLTAPDTLLYQTSPLPSGRSYRAATERHAGGVTCRCHHTHNVALKVLRLVLLPIRHPRAFEPRVRTGLAEQGVSGLVEQLLDLAGEGLVVRTGLAEQGVSGPVVLSEVLGSLNPAMSEQGLQSKGYPDVYDNMIRILTIDQIPNIHSHTFRAFSFFCWAFSISCEF